MKLTRATGGSRLPVPGRLGILAGSGIFLLLVLAPGRAPLTAQTGEVPQIDNVSPSDSIPRPETGEANQTPAGEVANPAEPQVREKGLNLLNLLSRGGWFMVPLGLLSIMVVALGIERTLALREQKMMPRQFVSELGAMSRHESGFDPRLAFRLCQSWPSAASRVIRVMLLKAGRPQSEIDQAVSEACQREAGRLQTTVSWLTLAAAVAPLIGLLGTVWGMIQAFYDTTQLVPGQNKAEVLAQGIYTALVTTLSGLVIAIPSAVLAHWFDNRIVAWFHRIEELAASLTPLLEPFEGQVRVADPENPLVRQPASPPRSEETGVPAVAGSRRSAR